MCLMAIIMFFVSILSANIIVSYQHAWGAEITGTTCVNFFHVRNIWNNYQEHRLRCDKSAAVTTESYQDTVMELYNGLQLVREIGESLNNARLQRGHRYIHDAQVNSKDVALLVEQFLAATNVTYDSYDGMMQNSRSASFICESGRTSLDVNYLEYVETKCHEIQQCLNYTQNTTFVHVNCAEEFLFSRRIVNPSMKVGIVARNNRRRRALPLIIPGTNWCGVGNVSSAEQTYGNNFSIDRCCHEHDNCGHTIEGFTTKYRLYNFRFHTLSHCECDDRFRTCLRALRSEEANRIGHWFFNVIGMRCFLLQWERVCSERNWWGKCIRYTTEPSAVMHNRLVY